MQFHLLWVNKWHQNYAWIKKIFVDGGIYEHDNLLLVYHTSEYDELLFD